MSLLEIVALAIEQDDSNQVESLISSGSIDDVNARLPRLHNPPALVFAARHGRVEIAALLLRAGARIDDADDQKHTACHVAANGGDVGLMKLLVAHRPTLSLTNVYKLNPLQIAARKFDVDGDIALVLLDAGAPLDINSVCQLAAKSLAALEWLLKHDVAIGRMLDQFVRTPLHIAVGRRADLAVLHKLIGVCGVDLEARDLRGDTCLHTAAFHRNAVAVRCLLDAGAVVDSVSDMGATPLHNVSDYECALLLLAAGANAHARDLRAIVFKRAADSTTATRIMHALIAAGFEMDDASQFTVDADQVEAERRAIAKARLDFVRQRAIDVCIGLQSRGLDALQMCEILVHACGPLAGLVKLHQWWAIATTVKHFQCR